VGTPATTSSDLRTVEAIRYVTPLREGGSLPAVVEADDDGMYVLKFRGAGQGTKALAAEVVAGELGRALGLPVPELVLMTLDPTLGNAEPDVEIQELIAASAGLNLGMDFLPGALAFNPAAAPPIDPDLAANVVWFDALVTNVDRTPRNPNLLLWHGRLWLIDHGAALYVQHGWDRPQEHARRRLGAVDDHVLLPLAGSVAEADARLAPLVTEDLLQGVADLLPDDWLGDGAFASPVLERRAYVDYLLRRLEEPRLFVAEAEEKRRGAR
jgi:hypothetical protein